VSNASTSPTVADDRVGPPFLDQDRPSLAAWLEFYRRTLPIKVGGLTPEQLCQRSVPPSTMSLIGIVRHLAQVEQYWFANVVSGTELPMLYSSADDADAEFNDVSPQTALDDLARYHAELPRSRAAAARITDLDAPLPGRRHGQLLNLRWIYLHMIEEYARHLGHVDLIRECVDGSTGY
jgi:hypothetical protein